MIAFQQDPAFVDVATPGDIQACVRICAQTPNCNDVYIFELSLSVYFLLYGFRVAQCLWRSVLETPGCNPGIVMCGDLDVEAC